MSQACEGRIRYKQPAARSDRTIFDYRVTFKELLFYFPDDPPIASIPRACRVEVSGLAAAGYIAGADGLAPREAAPLSAKSVNNIPTSLLVLRHWALDEGWERSMSSARSSRR